MIKAQKVKFSFHKRIHAGGEGKINANDIEIGFPVNLINYSF